jgi:glycogen debranching enzyme
VALVPAALTAAERLYRSGLLGAAQEPAATAARYGDAWKDTARYFQLTVPLDTARRQVAAYAAAEGLDGSAAVASITAPVRYEGVALDAAGKPVPVMHSDSGFVLLFSNPDPAYLDAVAAQIVRPFPAGLRTEVGVVVANPAYAPDAVKQMFTRKDYHGTVVWSWQQAMLASGLKRQLARTDLPAGTRAALRDAQRLLWQGILAMQDRSSGELWGWQPKNGKAVLTMWDSAEGDEACAAQLWSTVYLAIKPPALD